MPFLFFACPPAARGTALSAERGRRQTFARGRTHWTPKRSGAWASSAVRSITVASSKYSEYTGIPASTIYVPSTIYLPVYLAAPLALALALRRRLLYLLQLYIYTIAFNIFSILMAVRPETL